KNILLLFNEINIADDNLLRNELKEHFNDYEIKIESSFLYNVNKEFYNNKYDLILSDEANLKNNINIINILDLNDIIENINNYILENHLKRRKASTN
ncbi:MAG: hypothetical protein ACRDBY_13130, partial [Cetobacterium sp.]